MPCVDYAQNLESLRNDLVANCRIRIHGIDAEDVVHEAFVRRLRKDSPSSPTPHLVGWRSYLFRATHHLGLDEKKSLRHRKVVPLKPEHSDCIADDNVLTPDEILSKLEQAQLVRDAVARLPDKDRNIIERWMDGEDQREIATALGLTFSEVKVRYRRALVLLGVMLKNPNDDV